MWIQDWQNLSAANKLTKNYAGLKGRYSCKNKNFKRSKCKDEMQLQINAPKTTFGLSRSRSFNEWLKLTFFTS